MKRAIILAHPVSDRLPRAPKPANDNNPPEPPPAASQRAPRMPRLMAAIAKARAGTWVAAGTQAA